MAIRHYVQILLKGWWLIVPALLLSMTSALIFTYSQTPIYRTEATFVISPSSSFGTVDQVIRGLDTLTQRDSILATYAHIAASDIVVKTVYQEMGLAPEQRTNLKVTSELVSPTNIIKIIVESDDPAMAKACASLVGQRAVEYIKNLGEIYDMRLLDPPYTPTSPSKPDKIQNMMLAVVLGLIVGIVGAFLLEYLRTPAGAITGVTIIDGATGIYNRHYFVQRFGEELSRAKRHQFPLSLTLINIDRLDLIKDMQLPRLRNEALRQIGIFLKQHLREEDLVARFEDDTFAVLFPDTPGPDAERVLQKLKKRLEWSIFELDGGSLKLNLAASIGVVAYDLNGTGRDELLDRAKKALQYASSNGEICLYTAEETGLNESQPTA